MPAGRPTLYRPQFCDVVIKAGKLGKSKAQMASALDVSRGTLDDWAKANPEFADAIVRAREHAMAWWEEKGRTHLIEKPMGKKINAQLWSRSMAARFPDDYRENSKVELSGTLTLAELVAQSMKTADDPASSR